MIELLVWGFWCLVAVATFSAGRRLFRGKWAPVGEVVAVIIVLIYAITLRIYFST